MTTVASSNRSRRWLASLLAPSLLAVVGCGATASPAPSEPAVPAASSSIAAVADPSPAAIASASPPLAPPTVAPSPSLVVSQRIGPAPAGPWSTIAWIDGGDAFPLRPTPGSDDFLLSIYGWSGGYVAFAADAGSSGDAMNATLSSASSADGIHWSPATAIGLLGLENEVEIVGLAEAPGGLVAIGEYPPDTCGGPATFAGLWRSSDGAAWTRVEQPRAMAADGLSSLHGGPSGFIATGSGNGTPVVWLSADGATWHAARLPTVSAGKLVVDGGFSVPGGFVLAGAIVGPPGCGGHSEVHPAVWWSPDGATWTREALPHGLTGPDVSLSVAPIGNGGLVATEDAAQSNQVEDWVSADGRTWTTSSADPSTLCCALLTAGGHTIAPAEDPNNVGPWTIHAVADDLGTTTLVQSGAIPVDSETGPEWRWAAGPTGLVVVANDGSNVRLGVPGS